MTTRPPWTAWLDRDELEALRESEAWTTRPPGALARVMGFLERPLERAWSRVPERVLQDLGRAVYGVLSTVLDTSEKTLAERAVLDLVCAEVGREISDLREVRRVDLRALDRVARRSVEAHRRAAAVEGGVSGLAGLPGLVMDVPALYGLIFRMIQEISLAYGFPVAPPSERIHILKVLDVGHRSDPEARRNGLQEIEAVQGLLHAGVPTREIEKQVLLRGLQALAEKLGVELAHRKLAQALAVVGSVVGAGVNYQLLGEVGDTAWHAYRRRFLMERALARQGADSRPTRRLD